MYDRLQREIRADEYEMEVLLCELEEGLLLDDEEDRVVEERFHDSLMSY